MQFQKLEPPERMYSEERRAFKQAVICAVRDLSRGDAEATAIMDFAIPRLALRQPLPGHVVGYFDKPAGVAREDMLLLAPVRAADSWLLEADAPAQQFSGIYHAETIYGLYYRETRSIYMPMDWALSPDVCALIFLHECTHAYDHLSRRRPLTRWRSELHARQLESRLLSQLHPAVAEPRDDVDAAIAGLLAGGRPLGAWEPSPAQISHADLAQLFGPEATFADRHYYRGALGRAMVQRHLMTQKRESYRELQRLAVID